MTYFTLGQVSGDFLWQSLHKQRQCIKKPMFTQSPLDTTFTGVYGSAQRPLFKVTNNIVSEEQTSTQPFKHTRYTHTYSLSFQIYLLTTVTALDVTTLLRPPVPMSRSFTFPWKRNHVVLVFVLFHIANAFKVHPCFPNTIYCPKWQDFLVLFFFYR